MPNVNFILPELREVLPYYGIISDCLAGEKVVKDKGVKYLPKPDPTNETRDNDLRYKQYVERAQFYNATRRTLNGLVGEVFSHEPLMEIPSGIAMLENDITGTGNTIIQLAKQTTSSVLAKGRAGIFVDYPKTEGGATRQDITDGVVRPVINFFRPENVINWRTEARGALKRFTLVVLKEKFVVSDDGFEQKKVDQWRVLRLVNNVYIVEIYRDSMVRPLETFAPTDAAGNTFSDIPFRFVGSDNNDPDIDDPPMYDLAATNIGHYRNSADYEEAVYTLGQPTVVVTGISEQWYKDVLNGKIRLGSRGGIPLPVDADAKLIQPEPNTMAFEALQHKERQMVALGARLVEMKSVQRTATEAQIDSNSETSTLISTAENVSTVFTWALEVSSKYAGSSGTPKFVLNTDFNLSTMTPEEQKQAVFLYQSQAISWKELRTRLRYAGIATLTDEEARKEIDAEALATQAAELERMEKETAIISENDPPADAE